MPNVFPAGQKILNYNPKTGAGKLNFVASFTENCAQLQFESPVIDITKIFVSQ